MTEPVDNVVHFTASAQKAYEEAVTLLMAAHTWAAGADLTSAQIMADNGTAGERIVGERRTQVIEMERSLLANLARMLTVSQAHDGPLRVTRDMEASFFWRHEKSGYHGGLIYHASYASEGTERLPVGTWSIHT